MLTSSSLGRKPLEIKWSPAESVGDDLGFGGLRLRGFPSFRRIGNDNIFPLITFFVSFSFRPVQLVFSFC